MGWPAGRGTMTTKRRAMRLSSPTMPNGATNITTSRMMARISVAGEPSMFSQSLNTVPTMPSPVSPASRVRASSRT